MTGLSMRALVTRVDKTNISGWARNIRQPIERVKAQIKIDNEIEVVTVSDIYTETLDKKGLGDGSLRIFSIYS